MKKRIFLLASIVSLVSLAIGFYLWNKPPETVEGKEGMSTTAVSITSAFEQDEQVATNKYLSQVLSVKGTVAEITNDQDNAVVLLLSGTDPLNGVQCTMKEKYIAVEIGSSITVKGFCSGYTTVVLLTDCIIEKEGNNS